MFYRVIDINDLFTNKEDDHEIIELISNSGSQLKLISIKKNSGFDSHMSNTNVFLYVTEGELELFFPKETICGCSMCGTTIPEKHDNENREYKIKKGQMFIFEKDTKHSLKAVKDSKFIMVKI